MNTMKIELIVIVALAMVACGLQANECQISIHVTDESGIAVSNAQVVAQFANVLPPGEGWGSGCPTEAKGVTDPSGSCILTGASTGDSVAVGIMKDNYYHGNAELIFTNAILSRWMPWNPIVEVVLKQKGVQVPMYARRMKEIKIPVEGKPTGFDLMAGDWVAPYGNGQTSDFLIKFDSKLEPKAPPREFPPYDVTLTFGFSNDGDGIQSILAPPRGTSELRLPRLAPVGGYEPIVVKHIYKGVGHIAHTDYQEDKNYFFRVRTKKDAQGNIIDALYGKISGDFRGGIGGVISFTYYLNPELNSRNMEFDPKRNLSTNLKFMEGVSAP